MVVCARAGQNGEVVDWRLQLLEQTTRARLDDVDPVRGTRVFADDETPPKKSGEINIRKQGKRPQNQRNASQLDIGRRMWKTGWGQVSGEWDEQQNIG